MNEGECDVLLIDDDEDIRDALKDFLEETGVRVACVEDGGEALEYLARYPPPSVILLDVMMPRMNGREFRRRQLLDETVRDIPVVLVTADLRLVSPREATDESGTWDLFGALERLKKPFEEDELLRVVRKYCAPFRASPAEK